MTTISGCKCLEPGRRRRVCAARSLLLALAVLAPFTSLASGEKSKRVFMLGPSAPLPSSPPGWDLTGWDLTGIRERTTKLRALQDTNAVLTQPVLFPSDLSGAIVAAQRAAGLRPTFLQRFHLAGRADDGLRAQVEEQLEQLGAAQKQLERDVSRAERFLGVLDRAELAGPLAAIPERVRDPQRDLRERAADVDAHLERVRRGLALRLGGFWARVHLMGMQLAWRDPATELDFLRRTLSAWGADRPGSVLGAELTYVQGGLTSPSLSSALVAPAYAVEGGDLQLEDTTAGREVELSTAVRTKAAELGSAKAAYDFVRNEVRLDWYFGCMKGSTETLRSKRGNDVDASALLVALLRAQDVPARFVEGTVELPIARIAELMSLLDASELDSLRAGSLPAARLEALRALVLAALGSAGIPHEPVIAGGAASAVRLQHVWVEALLPYGDYRGAGRGVGAKVWAPLEPSFHATARYAADPGLVDGYALTSSSAEALVSGYLGARTLDSPLQYVQRQVRERLAAVRPEVDYGQAIRAVRSLAETLPFIPGTLPFQVVGVNGEFAFVPESLKHRVRFLAADPQGTLVDVTLPLHELAGHRTVFTYRGATEADADVIANAGGMYAAPAASTQVTPVVRVDGAERASGTRALGLGVEHDWSVSLLLPDGSVRTASNRIVAGNLAAVGFGTPGNAYVEEPITDRLDLDGPAPKFLYRRVAAYASQWTQSEEELADLLRIVPLHPTANLTIADNQTQVDQALGVRRKLVWKGLEIDADHRATTPLELVPRRGKEFLRLSGYQGSFLEAQVLTEGTGEASTSAILAIQEAGAQGIPVLRLNPQSPPADLSALASFPEVVLDVTDQLARGREVIVPSADVSYADWTGVGFIARNPATEEGGYFLSGWVSGGQTIVSPAKWTDQELVKMLEQPDAPNATTDQSDIAFIAKVPGADFQRAVVGKPLPQDLAVYVLTSKRVPVKGASVTFRTIEASKPQLADPLAPDAKSAGTITVKTDGRGKAAVRLSPDTAIRKCAVADAQVPYDQLVGLDVVTADVANAAGTHIVLKQPFYAFGDPDVPATIELLSQTTWGAPSRMILGQELPAWVKDRWDNPLANQVVLWIQSPATGAFLDPANRPTDHVALLDPGDPAQHMTLEQVSSTLGEVVTSYINGGARHTLTAAVGAAMNSYTVAAVDSDRIEYVLGYITSQRSSFDGLYSTDEAAPVSYPEPMRFQLLRPGADGEPPWVPIAPESPGYGALSFTMKTLTDKAYPPANPLGPSVTSQLLPAQTTATFWPRYLARGGTQTLEFSAELYLASGSKDCCDNTFDFSAQALSLDVTAQRVLPTGEVQAVDPVDGSLPGDSALALRIKNPASFPIYARIEQRPLVATEPIVEIPPPEVAPRHEKHTDLIRIDAFATTTLRLQRIAVIHGGTVHVEVLAPDPATGPDALTSLGKWQWTVSTLYIDSPPHLPAPARNDPAYVKWVGTGWFGAERAYANDANNVIHAHAIASGSDPLSWTVEGLLGAARPNNDPVVRNETKSGADYSFTPRPLPHTPNPFHTGGGDYHRAAPLSYRITVTGTSASGATYSNSHVITQDEIDTILQEYWNHGLQTHALMPQRSDFHAVEDAPPFPACELGRSEYAVTLGTPGALAQKVLEKYNELLFDDEEVIAADDLSDLSALIQHAPHLPNSTAIRAGESITVLNSVLDTPVCFGASRPACPAGASNPAVCCDDRSGYELVNGRSVRVINAGPDGIVETHAKRMANVTLPASNKTLRVSSAWRNPQRNEMYSHFVDSRHQFGNAVDMTAARSHTCTASTAEVNGDSYITITGVDEHTHWCTLLQAAYDVRDRGDAQQAQAEDGASQTALCNTTGIGHVHVQADATH